MSRVGSLRVGVAYDVDVEGDYAYVTNNEGAVVVDVGEPGRPKRAAKIDVGGSTFGIFVTDGVAYLASGDRLSVAAGQGLIADRVLLGPIWSTDDG